MLCLAHAPCLNVLGDGAVHLSLEAGLEFADAHAGDACKALQRYVKSIVVVYIAYGVLYPADILCGKGTLFFISLPAVNICHQRYCLRDLCLVKKRSGNAYNSRILLLDCDNPCFSGGSVYDGNILRQYFVNNVIS